MPRSESQDFERINQLAEEFTQRLRAGERPSVEEYCDRYPDIAGELRDLLPALAEVEQVKDAAEDPPTPELPKLRRVGEYHILREVGRGGMGVVYEAEDIRLGRRVALKVLPGGKIGDALERFRREARAAARLHHTNIVPVFGVGEHDGLSYYVMQFIQGLGLDEVLKEVKRLQARSGSPVPPSTVGAPAPRPPVSATVVARSLVSGLFEPPPKGDTAETLAQAAAAADVGRICNPSGGEGRITNPSAAEGRITNPSYDAVSGSAISLPGQSNLSGRRLTYWQSIAQIGLQVADALEYAHKQGVLHRDIKPSNLLLDLHGVVWVTDFGLAKAADQQDLTHTGDVLGTLRYLPPEAFEGKSDARSDLYALGLTLYELLALRPAYDEHKKERLVKQVTTTDPPRLGSLNRAIPRDLRTIVHKTIEKDPGHRYASAAELAADLRRFAEDRPIRARTVGPTERAWRWCRRNPVVAGLMAAVAVLLVAGTAASTYFAVSATVARDRADVKAGEAESHARWALAERDWADQKAAEAETSAADAQANLYIVRMNAIQLAWDNGHPALARDLLARVRPRRPAGPNPDRWEWRYFDRLCHQSLRTIETGTDNVACVAFSRDGRRVATGGERVRVWDAATGTEVMALVYRGWTDGLAFSPDGRRLATAGYRVRVADAATGEGLIEMDATAWVNAVSYSPDGTRLASGGEDRHVRIWDAQTGRPIRALVGHTAEITDVAFSPDGSRVASAAKDGTVRLWDPTDGREVFRLTGHQGPSHGLSFRPDGRVLASAGGGPDNAIRLWDVPTGQPIGTLRGHTRTVHCVSFSPDGRLLASGSSDDTARVWDPVRGVELVAYRGHASGVLSVAFSPDGHRLATGSIDDTLRLWTVPRPPEPRALTGHINQVRAVGFAADGRLVSVGQDGRINVWDPVTGQTRRPFSPTATGYLGLAISPDGRLLATSGEIGVVEVWDLTTGQSVWTAKGHPSWIAALAFSPDGRWLATGGARDPAKRNEPVAIRLWEAATGKEVRDFRGHTDEVKGLVFTPDGARLVSGSDDQTIRVWDVTTGAEVRTLRGHTRGVTGVALHRDGNLLASSGADRTARLWDLAAGREVRSPLVGHFDTVWGVAFHPDGDRLATAGWDQTVRLWDVATGLELATLKGHTDRVLGVAFSPDGHWLASAGGRDLTVRVWDARPRSPAHAAEAEAVAVLDALFARPLPRAEVRAALQRDPLVGEATRQMALELIDRYPEETDATRYHAPARVAVRHPYSNPQVREFALAQARTACRLAPENRAFRNTLGLAQYRLGLYPEALETLGAGESDPADLAVVAMTRHRLGKTTEARAALARARELLRGPRPAGDEETQDLVREAEALIEGTK